MEDLGGAFFAPLLGQGLDLEEEVAALVVEMKEVVQAVLLPTRHLPGLRHYKGVLPLPPYLLLFLLLFRGRSFPRGYAVTMTVLLPLLLHTPRRPCRVRASRPAHLILLCVLHHLFLR